MVEVSAQDAALMETIAARVLIPTDGAARTVSVQLLGASGPLAPGRGPAMLTEAQPVAPLPMVSLPITEQLTANGNVEEAVLPHQALSQ